LGDLAPDVGIVPELGRRSSLFQPGQFDGFAVEVKETSAPRPSGGAGR
jgi:hypothetical protein